MKRLRLYALAVLVFAAFEVLATPALAHPMGNFSINHYSSLQLGPHSVRILTIVDMAEIPTFQELSSLGVETPSHLSAPARTAYLHQKATQLAHGLNLLVDGRTVPLHLSATDLLFPPGAGNLATERIYLVLDAPLPASGGTLAFSDDNFVGRAGWKEIVSGGNRVTSSTVPHEDRSKNLTVYPSTVVSSPPQDVSATLHFAPAGTALAVNPSIRQSAPALIQSAEDPLLTPAGGWSVLARGLTRKGMAWNDSRRDPLSDLIGRSHLTLDVLLLSLVLAFWFGAGHALSPGHGKTMVAAYLVGSRGTSAQAAILGLTVTVTHTAGVFALGLVVLYLSNYVVPDQLYPWLGFLSGAMVAAMGLTLFVRRLYRLSREPETPQTVSGGHDHHHRHDHVHEHHAHGHHHHSHGDDEHHVHRHGLFGRPHSHTTEASAPSGRVSARTLIGLGISGGILPCPSALLVLLSAIAFHHIAFGMLLIVAFSLGLATTLTLVGLAVVYSGRLVGIVGGQGKRKMLLLRGARVVPVLSALAVAAIGGAIALNALDPGMLPTLAVGVLGH